VLSSQLEKLWPPSALFWWTSGEGFASEPMCLCAAATFTRVTDYLASEQQGQVAQSVSTEGQRMLYSQLTTTSTSQQTTGLSMPLLS